MGPRVHQAVVDPVGRVDADVRALIRNERALLQATQAARRDLLSHLLEQPALQPADMRCFA